MDVKKYSGIQFWESITEHSGILTVRENDCSYYYEEAEPRWHHNITFEEANNNFNKGSWMFGEGVHRNK